MTATKKRTKSYDSPRTYRKRNDSLKRTSPIPHNFNQYEEPKSSEVAAQPNRDYDILNRTEN